jgi:hypothetical protein
MKHKTLVRDSAVPALVLFLGLGLGAVACEHDCDSCGHDAPAAPHDVALELFKSGVHLTWEDASDDEDTFIVERWARSAAAVQYDGSGKLSAGLARPSEGQTFGVHFVELVELPENTEDYFDDDVDVGMTYAYRIRAVSGAGSSLSEEVEITVP